MYLLPPVPTLRLPEDVYQEIRAQAAAEDRKMSMVLRRAWALYMAQQKKPKKAA